jgi:hypothetical protein
MHRVMSETAAAPLALKMSSAINPTSQFTPAIPTPSFPFAPTVPATCVP